MLEILADQRNETDVVILMRTPLKVIRLLRRGIFKVEWLILTKTTNVKKMTIVFLNGCKLCEVIISAKLALNFNFSGIRFQEFV